ncbi:MAG: RNA polymerase subunit sigma [Phycisphaerales bacterium]|nr:RNA polymerase subunit sigma [Phycisphaerales bacterium]
MPTAALIALLYQDLKAIARSKLAGERSGHTLSATALVHEAYVRLQGNKNPWSSRKQFFDAAAMAMQRVLIDHARRRKTIKRGGQLGRESFDDGRDDTLAMETSVDHEALSDHLARLRDLDPLGHQIVMLRYFAGLSTCDVADLLSEERHAVGRRWRASRAWLLERMRPSEAQQ